MESIKKFFTKNGWVSISESVVIAILGLILACKPEGTVKVISCILGIIFILVGVYKILEYYASEDRKDLYNYGLVFGLIAIVLGIVTIKFSTTIASIFRIMIGIWIIYSALLRISSALKLKELSNNLWVYSLILAIIMMACGLFVTFNSGAVIVTIGIMMIVYSVIDIIEDLIFMKNVNNIF